MIEHLAEFGTDREGRLFRGARGGQLFENVYSRVWQKAREGSSRPCGARNLPSIDYDRNAAWLQLAALAITLTA